MKNLLVKQQIITEGIEKIIVNFKKDSPSRKTKEYGLKRLEALEALWSEFEVNHNQLLTFEDTSDHYFTSKSYETVASKYEKIKEDLRKITQSEGVPAITETGGLSKTDELMSLQGTNFRAFSRMVRNIDINTITEKWEIEDKLQTLQARWRVIDDTHWQIDNLLIGTNLEYEEQFSKREVEFEAAKRELHRKLNTTSHQQRCLPPIEIPTFTGNYAQWPTFMDLYCEAIHNNPMLTPTQKMQHLKGKLRGEAERIVQHLTVTGENYDACWEILTHRYNNKQLLFTRQIQIFMNQSTIPHQSSSDLKRLYDTSLETIHAIHNLGIETTSWDPILVHILAGKLDSDTYASYMETRKQPRELPSFDEFMEFIQRKFTALEPIIKKKPVNNPTLRAPAPNKENPAMYSRALQPSSSKPKHYLGKTYHVNTERNCPLCKSDHFLLYCQSFKQMTSEVKLKTISQLNICKNCMYSHNGKPCTSIKRCRVCSKQHHTSLHDVLRETEALKSPPNLTPLVPSSPALQSQRRANHVTGDFNEVLLATAQLKIRSADGTYLKLRCLLDQGSQINLITESAAQRLGLQRRKQNATIAGIGFSASQSHGTVQLVCESLFGEYTFTTEALVMTKMLNNLPNYTFEKQQWPHLENINLADSDYNISRPVDILLDAGVYADIVMAAVLRGPPEAPIAQQTKLGWVLMGNVKTFNCHAILNNIEDISRFWEMEEIMEPHPESAESDYCETLYANTTRRREDGRYEVRIPMKPNFEQHLGASRPQAFAQFRQLENKLAKNKQFAEGYKAFIDEYIDLNHMKECLAPREPSCILPHHGVLKPESTTTALRVVFNSSAKTSSGHSLNDLMECGPNIQQDLQSIIMRWRSFEFVYTADIEKFYRQILVHEEDQHLQKIVWRDSTSAPIKEYQLCTVSYGSKSASFLAMRTIKQLIQDDKDKYPSAAPILEHQLYVDDLLGGSNTLEEAKTAQSELIEMMKGGGFNLRKWASNSHSLLENLPEHLINQNMLNFKHADTNKTLGINWNPRTDQFTFKHDTPNNKPGAITKRKLLSDISKLYDPLGWLAPITMKAKLIFQQTWAADVCTWDAPLPDCIQHEWEQFSHDLPQINKIAIPRWMGNTLQPIELHGFSDASEKAYACAIYCKSIDDQGQHVVKLVAGKTKLAPLKTPISLPKLELSGAQLLSQLMKRTIESINVQNVTVCGWTDSMVVLGWLHGDPSRWKTFVSNRVMKITETMPAACWKHVKSEDNPVDCASRGLNPTQLISHPLWWEGPTWLKDNKIPTQMEYHTDAEQKKIKQVYVTQNSIPLIKELLNNSSSMARVTRVLSWVLRFINNARDAKSAKRTSHLATYDLDTAHNAIIKATQLHYFADEIAQLKKCNRVRSTSSILNLNPFLDKNYIIRVGGRLEHADLSQEQKHPIILPYNSKLTELLIDQAHKQTLHGGARLTLSHLRNRHWVISGLRAVKKQLVKCIRCHRFKTAQNNQLMADLPPPRVTPSRPFTHTGVDFTGHVEVKANKGRGIRTMKAYIAVFICLCTKAIHLELVSDLSTAAYLNALKRLCARRGKPHHIYSDNGTNFVGAARALNKQHQEALQYYINDDVITSLSQEGIEWHFNAPSWPTAGGLWERAVRSLKHHLKRVLGDQKLTFEEFYTLLTQIEACLNSRPLVALTENIDNIDCLTPAHFLIGEPMLEPPSSIEDHDMPLTKRWQLVNKMFKDFWKKWSMDYLQTLQTRSKWHFPTTNLEIGDIVIVKEDNIPPAKWILGRVLETHPGPDGRVRVVTLKAKASTLKRPVTKLSRLPLDSHNPITPPRDEVERPTIQGGRRTRNSRKHFNNLFCTLLMLVTMCVGPSMTQMTNITELNPARLIYFDKVADIQIIQEEWKLVVYYNMTTYWKSLYNIQNYVNHFNTLCQGESTYLSISSQFQHELDEIKHYNDILHSEHGSSRQKRGLIDGIGYVANSLFGVLDQRFADQYEKDIQTIQSNENHLLKLYKNHTSILESEYNLLKRNEKVMNTQFRIIEKHLAEAQQEVRLSHDSAMYITSTALAVNMMISNIRLIQQHLLDLVTDVRDGKVDTHLIKPDQFEDQLNIISGQLPSELSLPCVNTRDCTRSQYQLARVHTRLTSRYLLFEVKLPLINNEQYELNRIIPIPKIIENKETTLILTSPYLAVNLKRDMLVPLEDKDVSSCTTMEESQLLCTINQPIYNIKAAKSYCEAQIINNGDLSTCRTKVSDCNDRWVRLHNRGAWLFSCCEECTTRIFCPAGVTSKHLNGVGLMTLNLGCMLKADSFIINAHKNYHSELSLTPNEEKMYLRESSINHILTDFNYTFTPEDHKATLDAIKTKIDKVKEQQETLSVQSLTHESHHYLLYSVVGLISLTFITWGALRLRRKYLSCSANLHQAPDSSRHQPTQGRTPRPEQRANFDSVVDNVIVTAAHKLDKASSP